MSKAVAERLPAPLLVFFWRAVSFVRGDGKVCARRESERTPSRSNRFCAARKFWDGVAFFACGIALGYPWSPDGSAARANFLNTFLGLSMLLMGGCAGHGKWLRRCGCGDNSHSVAGDSLRRRLGGYCHSTALTTPSPSSCRALESYINGGQHTSISRSRGSFPFFPGRRFSFSGLAVGFPSVFRNFAKRKDATRYRTLGGAGILACALSVFFRSSSIHL